MRHVMFYKTTIYMVTEMIFICIVLYMWIIRMQIIIYVRK